ncbi:MAG: hypothetical protein HZA46_12570 [Planctomycetales bacterium]|nr:hypothetical protein [Planctomycetales bacterium]
MVAPNFQTLMQHALSLVQLGMVIGAVTVVALNMNLSRRMWMPLVGFLIQALVVVASAAMTFAIQSQVFSGGGSNMIGVVFLLIRAGGLLGWLLIVGGLWGVFSDIQQQLARRDD